MHGRTPMRNFLKSHLLRPLLPSLELVPACCRRPYLCLSHITTLCPAPLPRRWRLTMRRTSSATVAVLWCSRNRHPSPPGPILWWGDLLLCIVYLGSGHLCQNDMDSHAAFVNGAASKGEVDNSTSGLCSSSTSPNWIPIHCELSVGWILFFPTIWCRLGCVRWCKGFLNPRFFSSQYNDTQLSCVLEKKKTLLWQGMAVLFLKPGHDRMFPLEASKGRREFLINLWWFDPPKLMADIFFLAMH